MRKRKVVVFIAILLIITGIMALIHFHTRKEVPEGAIEVSFKEETYMVDVSELEFEQVTGIRVNGKGEEKAVEASGILLRDVLAGLGITEFTEVSVVADDSYSAVIMAEEIQNDLVAYLIQEEGEDRLRLVVFGDKDSKRSVSKVTQIVVENVGNVDLESSKDNGSEGKTAGAVTFTDDLGREVTVDHPQRVAALLGSFADMWVLAGGEVIASADDAWDDFHLDMPKDAVNLGQTKDLSLEKLFEAEPDFIIASAGTRIDVEWKEILESSGIPCCYFDVSGFDDYLRVFKICTEITGRADLYEKYGLAVQSQIEEVVAEADARVSENGAPKVLFLRTSATMIRAKNSEDSVLGEMLKELGCINIADSDESLLENVSVEHILQEDPEFIFFVEVGDDKDAIKEYVDQFINDNPVWQELTAVKTGRVYNLDKTLYNLKPNDRWGEAYEKLNELLSEGQK